MSAALDPSKPPHVLVLVGPTAVGKTEVAVELASQLNGEIVSVDSMQVYRGMDIGTAKPSGQQLARVPHHLIDIVDVSQPFDAAQWVAHAQKVIRSIQANDKLTILCGGTGLYLRALFDGLGQAPSSSAALRAQLAATPLSELLQELQIKDPDSYARIDRQNSRRVIRAVEVLRLTGNPFSDQRAAWRASSVQASSWPPVFGLSRDRHDLVQRIDSRVDLMFATGLVAETEALLKTGLANNPTALQALGYRQVFEYRQGQRSLEETIELVKIRTRQFAKRQMTYFRRQFSVEWTCVEAGATMDQIARQIAADWNSLQPGRV